MEISFHRVFLYHHQKININEHIISMPWLVSVDDRLASYGTTKK